jgi:Spy/CpxP family protein refolding chaperone
MTKARVAIIVSFVVAFAAGGATGLMIDRAGPRPDHDRPWLERSLGLSPQKSKELRQIWERVNSAIEQQRDLRAAAARKRDDEIQALFTPEQAAHYERILQEFTASMDRLANERTTLFQEAEKQTEDILTPDQRDKYEKMRTGRMQQGRRPHRGERGAPRAPGPESPAGSVNER